MNQPTMSGKALQWLVVLLAALLPSHIPSASSEAIQALNGTAELSVAAKTALLATMPPPDCEKDVPSWVRDYAAWHAEHKGKPDTK